MPNPQFPPLETFVPKNEFLICIDSDGTAIDAMNVKHRKCHGPALIEEWHLQPHEQEIQKRWDDINLRRTTRGINRFYALVEIMTELNGRYLDVPDLDVLKKWVQDTDDLSNRGLMKEMEHNDSVILKKSLSWSLNLNKRIAALSLDDKPPFPGVIDFLASVHGKVDIAVISSSNMDAIFHEWGHYDMLKYLDVMTSQEIGTKGECIAKLLSKGYSPKKVMMIGDAYPDVDASKENGVFFYPILTDKEESSWVLLREFYFDRFIHDQFSSFQQVLFDNFKNNFLKNEEQ